MTGQAQFMMGLVHSSLRRDLARAHLVLSSHPDARRREAVGEHLLWLLDFLHHHHEGEDDVLWPEMLRRDPAIGELLERMDADHRAIADPITELETAARALIDGTGSAEQAVRAIDNLRAPLLPHLALEEQEAMAEADRLFTAEEFMDISNKTWRAKIPLKELMRGPTWFLDGLPRTDQDRFLADFPPPLRYLFRTVSMYFERRRGRKLWGDERALAIGSLPAEAA